MTACPYRPVFTALVHVIPEPQLIAHLTELLFIACREVYTSNEDGNGDESCLDSFPKSESIIMYIFPFKH